MLVPHYDKINHKRTLSAEKIEILKKELDRNYYPTCKSISDFIKRRFAKQYIPNGLRFLLKKLDYVYKQVKVVHGKMDSEKQKEIVKS